MEDFCAMLVCLELQLLFFTGAFRTSIRGLAHRFLQHLAAAVQHFSQRSSSEVHNRLSAALNRCQAQIKQCSGLAGCAVLISSDTLAFCASGIESFHPLSGEKWVLDQIRTHHLYRLVLSGCISADRYV